MSTARSRALRHAAAFLVLAGASAGCDSKSGDAAAATANGSTSGARRDSAAGRAGRPAPSITLAPGDIASATIETIEEGTPITGDLQPIETIDVRSRLEGDLTGVFVKEGQRVASGQLLARFDASEQESALRSAEADRESARTDVTTAQWNYDQSNDLFKAGAIAERDLRVTQQGLESAKARLAAAEARVRTTSLATRDTRVLAPANGIVSVKSVEDGERVSRGASMFTIVRNEVLELAAAVPARQASGLRVGQAVHFVADSRRFDGRVSRLSPTIDPATRAVTVYVEVPNPGGQLRGGTFASGRVVSRTLAGVLTVPTAAIRQSQEGGQPFAYRVEGRVVNPAPLQVGVIDERLGKAEVVSGLSAGDRVVVGNVGTLGRGMQVVIVGSESARPGGRAGAARGTQAR